MKLFPWVVALGMAQEIKSSVQNGHCPIKCMKFFEAAGNFMGVFMRHADL